MNKLVSFFKNTAKLVKLVWRVAAASDDKALPVGAIMTGKAMQSAMVSVGNGTNKIKNVLAVLDLPFGDTISGTNYGPWMPWFIYARQDPGTDTTFDEAPIGSVCLVITHTDGTPSDANLYLKTAASTWTVFGSLA